MTLPGDTTDHTHRAMAISSGSCCVQRPRGRDASLSAASGRMWPVAALWTAGADVPRGGSRLWGQQGVWGPLGHIVLGLACRTSRLGCPSPWGGPAAPFPASACVRRPALPVHLPSIPGLTSHPLSVGGSRNPLMWLPMGAQPLPSGSAGPRESQGRCWALTRPLWLRLLANTQPPGSPRCCWHAGARPWGSALGVFPGSVPSCVAG